MPKHQAVLVFIVAGLVVAVTLLVFQSRALTFKLQALEAKQAAPQVVTSAPVVPSGQVLDPASSPVQLAPQAEQSSPSMPSEAPQKPAPLPGTVLAKGAAPALTAAQEEAVARSVDRILNEKYGHLPKPDPEPIEKVLERELNLTPSQKERITGLLKKKSEESGTIFSGGNPFSGKNLQKAIDLDARYETLVKNELDAAQQAKYDQLKKDGKINNGIQIQINAGGDEE